MASLLQVRLPDAHRELLYCCCSDDINVKPVSPRSRNDAADYRPVESRGVKMKGFEQRYPRLSKVQ